MFIYNITKDCVTQEDKSPLKFSKETLNYEDFIKIRYLILILWGINKTFKDFRIDLKVLDKDLENSNNDVS